MPSERAAYAGPPACQPPSSRARAFADMRRSSGTTCCCPDAMTPLFPKWLWMARPLPRDDQAMSSFFAIVLLPLIVILLIAAVAAAVHRDGYGTRTPPPSRRSWADGLPVAHVR